MPYTTDLGEAIDAMRKRTVSLAWLAALTGLLALTSCDSATNSGMGTVRLHLASSGTAALLSDAASVGYAVSSATVTFSRAELMPGNEGIPLTTSTFELVGDEDPTVPNLVDGVTALLGAVETLGEYEQLRLIVSGATIIATGPNGTETYEFGDDASFPSGQQTGIKVNFGGPIEVGPGSVDLIAVFDLAESFVFHGPPDNPRSVSFKPVIHASTEVWPSIAGEVILPEGVTASVTVEALIGAEVKADTVFSVTGPTPVPYRLRFLEAGTAYTVTASPDGFAPKSQANVTAPASGVNFAFP